MAGQVRVLHCEYYHNISGPFGFDVACCDCVCILRYGFGFRLGYLGAGE